MHGGLPVIGFSLLVYGAVGVVVLVRDGVGTWRDRRRGRRGSGGACVPTVS
ncbi:hypothetical protein GCM10009801_13870 [Streptomyces albiaxialis]|uniref:Uncharacterized protein n=1 Tax=Streptomyces albiaxialis TaxID=329523 RepID=A0ABN2VN62_9ACTN